MLLYFFDKLVEQAKRGVTITVDWIYKSNEPDMLEQGEEFQDEFKELYFNFVAKENE